MRWIVIFIVILTMTILFTTCSTIQSTIEEEYSEDIVQESNGMQTSDNDNIPMPPPLPED